MKEYHKVQTVFLRNPADNFKTLLEGDWSSPELEVLKDIEWIWTEKIDGTNIRIMWDGQTVRFGGRSNKAEIPLFLFASLQEIFTNEKMKEVFLETADICLYGEGYGARIQKGGNYIPDGTSFILFDCKINDWWLMRDSLEDLAEKFSINIVPVIGRGPLLDAVEYCRAGFKSTMAYNKNYDAEGLVMKPPVELYNRGGKRIVTKIKYKDF